MLERTDYPRIASADLQEDWSVEELKIRAMQEIDRRLPEFRDLLRDVVRIPTDNPPGDTTECVAFLAEYLKARGLPANVYEPRPTLQSLVSYKTGRQQGRNLVLNGHLDQFPAGDPAAWSFDPYSGECRDGKILGRGVGDMKAGTVASLLCLVLIHELDIPFNGQLTATLVADEESGGTWGAQWLLENVPMTRGDASLNSEPSDMNQVLIGHKGKYWLKVETRHGGGLAAIPVEDDAIARAMQVAEALKKLQGWKLETPPDVADAVARARSQLQGHERSRGKSWVVDSTTVNVGVIQGGVQSNTIPVHCRMEVDIRTPLGVTTEDVQAKVEEALAETDLDRGEIDLEWVVCLESAYSAPEEEIVELVAANARQITGQEIETNVSFGSTDTRFWWLRGIPAAIYGTGLENIAVPDEHILEPQFGQVLKVHAATCIDYLCDG